MGVFLDIWRFRGFMLNSILREVSAQFRQTILGMFWLVLQPLAMITVYTVVFARVMGSRMPEVQGVYGYSIYLCAGLLTWQFFADALGRLQGVFVNNGHLLKKASFPRVCLPLIALGVASINFLLITALFVIFLLMVGEFPGWVTLAVLPALGVQMALTMGLGLVAATLNVFFRDVGQMVSMSLLFWFWLTPIVYPAHVLPSALSEWIWLNPMALLAHHYQHVMVTGTLPGTAAWQALGAWALLTLGLLAWGWRLYRLHSHEMADEL